VTPTVTQTLPIPQPECVEVFEIIEIKDIAACDTTYQVFYINPLAQGYITIPPSVTQYSSITVSSTVGVSETAIAHVSSNTTVFLGWSTEQSPISVFTTNTTLTQITPTCFVTYYAIFTSYINSLNFCYWPGNTFDLYTVCNSCETPVTMYYDTRQWGASNGILGVHWYQDSALTIPGNSGTYTINTAGTNSIIYNLSAGQLGVGGTLTITGNCGTNMFCEQI
jgi:hypothetical protein